MARKNNVSQGLQSHLQGMNEQQARRTLEIEGRRLKYIAVKVWRQYLGSYKPKEYTRTRDTQRGIKLGRVRRISPFEYGISLEFENDLMYHESIFGSNNKEGHSLMLISEGWHSKKLEAKRGRVYRLTYFEGIDYIGRVQREYMRFAPRGVRLDVNWSGKFLK